MNQDKITLGQLESFLLKSADILRGKTNASEFKECIFGMLMKELLTGEKPLLVSDVVEDAIHA
ncbi:hypothetical protein [Stieleria magnilauensis]|uniref:hypothetical protein n=1 Tax=Stieleria magnilauensis TaxID=2527963 RepID=UPI003AF65FD1